MTVKDEPRNRIAYRRGGINQRLDDWLDRSSPEWIRYLIRWEWHTRPAKTMDRVIGYGGAILMTILALAYLISTFI